MKYLCKKASFGFLIKEIMEHPENDPKYLGLNVNKGVPQPPSVNPYLREVRTAYRKTYSVKEYVEKILAGDITVLSQAVTLVESSLPEHQETAQAIIEQCLPHAGDAVRVGITGVPGAGKSTSIDAFGMYLLQKGHKLAVLAIDPSSERTKGSILGDKTRMEKLSVEQDAFIRPSPAAGSLGGVARKTRETIVLCEAAGFDYVFVETVGVGQSETAVHSMVDFFLLIQLAGTGDELQGIKRGIMEMADGIVINKADGDNIDKAKIAQRHFKNALHLYPLPESGWTPEVLTYSGYYNLGVEEVWDMIHRYVDFVKESGYFDRKRKEQAKYWMFESINEQLRNGFYRDPEIAKLLTKLEDEVLLDRKSSFTAAKEALDAYYARKK
jgi:LAO/AO transport system ATPase